MRRLGIPISLTILLLMVVILFSLYPAKAETTDGIIVDGADSTWRSNITASTGLDANIQTIQPSLVAQYTNATLKYKLLIVPPSLQAQLDGLVQSVTSDFANAVAYEHLVAIPTNLQAMLTTMLPAVEIEFANSSYYTSLHYPLALMDDTFAPVVNNMSVQSTLTSTVLTWSTNEFARCITNYGSQPGNYTQTISNALYYQSHRLTLQNLTQGATYFVQFTCTDQSRNTSTSPELSFTMIVEQRVWLPLIQK